MKGKSFCWTSLSCSAPGGQAGFSLAELTVVVAIIGTLMGFAVARFSGGTSQISYNSAIAKVLSDIRYARDMAMTGGQGTRVYMDSYNNKYYLKWADGTYLKNPVGGGDFIIQLGQAELHGVVITGSGLSNGRLDFNRGGSPRNGGAGFSGDLLVVTLNAKKQIFIRANTGFLKIADL